MVMLSFQKGAIVMSDHLAFDIQEFVETLKRKFYEKLTKSISIIT